MVKTQVRETVYGVFPLKIDFSIQFWLMVEVRRVDYDLSHLMQILVKENQFGC